VLAPGVYAPQMCGFHYRGASTLHVVERRLRLRTVALDGERHADQKICLVLVGLGPAFCQPAPRGSDRIRLAAITEIGFSEFDVEFATGRLCRCRLKGG